MGIYVWGTGCGASELISNGLETSKITAFIDNHPSADTFLGIPVLMPNQLQISDCELMIITARASENIRQDCLLLGLSPEKLFFLKNSSQLIDHNDLCITAPSLLGDTLYQKLCQCRRVISVPEALKHSSLPEADLDNDYVRLASLELLCRRLKHLPGNLAELGVYKGNFARCMNYLMPDRTLYLFDTFDGFEISEGAREKEQQHCTDAFLGAHKNTSIEQVLKKLPYPENAAVCPGYFPESAKAVSDTFCLVSLDVDFEDSTYEGLCWFWPKIVSGGYLLLHDWNSPKLSGVAKALKRFEIKLGHSIPSVPLCDTGGTLILCK